MGISNLSIWPAAVGGAFWDLLGDLSLFSIIILIILVGMSVVSWAIIIMKWKSLRAVLAGGERWLCVRGELGRQSLLPGGGCRRSWRVAYVQA